MVTNQKSIERCPSKRVHLNQSVGTGDEETKQWLTNIPTYSSHHRKTADPLSISLNSGRQTTLQLQASLEIRVSTNPEKPPLKHGEEDHSSKG
jgi:hypothetical protein